MKIKCCEKMIERINHFDVEVDKFMIVSLIVDKWFKSDSFQEWSKKKFQINYCPFCGEKIE